MSDTFLLRRGQSDVENHSQSQVGDNLEDTTNMVTTANAHPDEFEQNQRISKAQAMEEARNLLWSSDHGVLCTLSKKAGGWPFGSIVPYAVDAAGRPAILIANIAEHHKNIDADPRVSLFVHQGEQEAKAQGEDIQAFGRVTVMAKARRTTQEELEDVRPRYLFRVPKAGGYSRAHSFEFFSLEIERVRYIGGFGKIFWLDAEGFAASSDTDPLAPSAQGAIEHMNEDHRDALADMVKGFLGKQVEPAHVEMTGLDCRGLWVKLQDGERLRIDFPRPATEDDLRPLVIETVQAARARS